MSSATHGTRGLRFCEGPPIIVIYIEELRQVAPLNAEDQTGYVWAFLDEARDPSIVASGSLGDCGR
jgi:hypothetical protein